MDADGTQAEVESLASRGVGVFVLGIAQDDRTADLLDRLAFAGGRPRLGGERQFYDVRNEGEFAAALDTIVTSIEACEFELEGAPALLDQVRIAFAAEPVARDPSHLDGWDFNGGTTRVSFFGPACERVIGRPDEVRASVHCEATDVLGPDH